MVDKTRVDKAMTAFKALLAGGGPIALILSLFFHFGSDDADKIVGAFGALASFSGAALLLGPKFLTDNQMVALARGLLAANGAVSVILTRMFNLDSAVAQHYLDGFGALVSVAGVIWTVAGSSDSSILLQTTKVEGVESVHIDPATPNTAAQVLAATQKPEAAKVQFTPTLEEVLNSVETTGLQPTGRSYDEL